MRTSTTLVASLALPILVLLPMTASPANAVGCISGAVAGGIAGHYAGHHAVLGALGGCVAGHELKKHQKAAAAAKVQAQKYPDEITHTEAPPVPSAPAPAQ